MDQRDIDVVEAQLGRRPRGTRAVAHRCPCGNPDVVETSPRLPDGTPFPTLYYLTCPRATGAVGTLEAGGMMRDMTERLASDEELRAGYRAAHERYLARRTAVLDVPEIAGVSAGGMPDRRPAPDGVVTAEPSVVAKSPWFTDLWHSVEVAGRERAAGK